MPLCDKLSPKSLRIGQSRKEPLWKGPFEDGVTQSLLSRFLTCRERFRVLVIEGLKPVERFDPKKDFGNLWHTAEEAFAKTPAVDSRQWSDGQYSTWAQALKVCAANLCKRFPLQQQEVSDWYDKARTLFPRYAQYWASHPDTAKRTPLLQEQIFRVSYRLPSGRLVKLLGKWDSVDLLEAHEEGGHRYPKGLWIGENKTKSTIDPRKIAQTLSWDLQSMFYLTALVEDDGGFWQTLREKYPGLGRKPYPVLGIRYNVIRRSMHKTALSMIKKVEEDLADNRAGEWFSRWKVAISPKDVERFRKQTLDPILENLLDWYDEQCPPAKQKRPSNYHTPLHFRMPYFYNPLTEGGSGEVDHYLATSSRLGLEEARTLFPELEGG